MFIAAHADPYYIRPQDARYTGYVGRDPSFGWHINLDSEDNQTPTAQFVTGYRARLLKLGNESTILSSDDIWISGGENTTWNFDPRYLFTGTTVKPLRGFTFSVDSADAYGNITSGARLAVNNPQPPPPLNSGFVGYNGGVTYNVTPRPQADTSGIFLWCDASPSFTPTYDNVQFSSTNLAGSANIAPQAGSFYTWFSLVDSYGFSGSLAADGDNNAPIYGPISGNAEALFGTFFVDITDRLTGAFGYLTGAFTNLQIQITATGYNNLLMVNGLSGSITGNGTLINQALSVQTQQIVNTTGLALASQINAVSARLVTTGGINYALAGTVMDALATSGGAYAAYLTQLSSVTTGITATARQYMDVATTGSVNGLGGAAQARWGFEIDANGKIASMKATVNSFQSYGTAVFGNLDLQSDTFSAGSAGWRIKANGNAEFNNLSARGAITGGNGTYLAVLDGQTFAIGAPAGNRFATAVVPGVSDARTVAIVNTSNIAVATLAMASDHGLLGLFTSAGGQTIAMDGSDGSINCDTLDVDSTSNFDGNMTFPGSQQVKFTNGGNTVVYIDESNGLRLHGDGSHDVQVLGGGDLTCTAGMSATSFTTTSSRRWKNNILPISGAMGLVNQLSGVRFDWRTRQVNNDFGLIAEDVARVLPTAVDYDRSGDIRGVDYGRLTAVLIEAVKELSTEVNILRRT